MGNEALREQSLVLIALRCLGEDEMWLLEMVGQDNNQQKEKLWVLAYRIVLEGLQVISMFGEPGYWRLSDGLITRH
jgi:hypothetical protein